MTSLALILMIIGFFAIGGAVLSNNRSTGARATAAASGVIALIAARAISREREGQP